MRDEEETMSTFVEPHVIQITNQMIEELVKKLNDTRIELLVDRKGLSRTRFPWTQNWLNRSVQGGPEHDRQF